MDTVLNIPFGPVVDAPREASDRNRPHGLAANVDKQLYVTVDGRTYARYAIKTHFVGVGEDYLDLVRTYVLPHWRPGDLLSSSEKVVALCQGRIVKKEDMHIGILARALSPFASTSSAGIGVNCPYKMQFAIDEVGPLRVLFAAVAAGLGKLVGKKGVFYDIVGQEVTGLDGFYDHEFKEYGEFGIRIPEHPDQVCNEVEHELGVKMMIVDANDLSVEVLGKGASVPFSDEHLCELIADNPAGQSRELTPFILIREVTGPRG